jgi:hypothetical protein
MTKEKTAGTIVLKKELIGRIASLCLWVDSNILNRKLSLNLLQSD